LLFFLWIHILPPFADAAIKNIGGAIWE